ncbi:hypothetical protein RFI_30832 [Reticulomyxa filosa]|uniref:Uncharacterized protein n=1 Tax=Reticulomyxa filosa TaxID=46433 RepID=X6M0Q6_RETFI|nr:hypothetical protein RFI_30832 [Reticulomyxa filosa]|eukprot:ETO06560.1 hypothetical protein RFI_30832 [Reticulomyxa filosa]
MLKEKFKNMLNLVQPKFILINNVLKKELKLKNWKKKLNKIIIMKKKKKNFEALLDKIEEENKVLFNKEIKWNESQLIRCSGSYEISKCRINYSLLNLNFMDQKTSDYENEFGNDLICIDNLYKLTNVVEGFWKCITEDCSKELKNDCIIRSLQFILLLAEHY